VRVGCLLIPHFALQVELRRQPELREKPLLLIQSSGSRRLVLDASPRAAGVHPGMPLQEALARCKDAVLLEADLSAYQQASERIQNALEEVSPVVEDGGPGLAYVDLRGLSSMYGGEARLATALLQATPPGFSPKVGIADGKFPAYIAATKAEYHGAFRVPDAVRDFLADAPVELLPVPWKTVRRLRDFGLERLGQVAAVGIGPMQAQFGPQGKLAWELAQGRDEAPLVPRKRKESISEDLAFPAPASSLGMVMMGIESLLGRAWDRPERRGRHVRQVALDGLCFPQRPWSQATVFREPLGNRERLYRILKGKMESVILPGPMESLTLTLSGLTGEVGRQESLWANVRRQQQLGEALRQLEAQIDGPPPVYRYREVEPWSRVPERRGVLVPYNR
jgi:DNA polymerase-4/protein ImuB